MARPKARPIEPADVWMERVGDELGQLIRAEATVVEAARTHVHAAETGDLDAYNALILAVRWLEKVERRNEAPYRLRKSDDPSDY